MAERCGVRRRCQRAPGPFTQVTVFGYRTATADAATYGSRWVSLTRILAAPSGWAAAGTGLPKITAVVSVGHGHFYAEAGSSSLAPGGTPRARKSSSSQPGPFVSLQSGHAGHDYALTQLRLVWEDPFVAI